VYPFSKVSRGRCKSLNSCDPQVISCGTHPPLRYVQVLFLRSFIHLHARFQRTSFVPILPQNNLTVDTNTMANLLNVAGVLHVRNVLVARHSKYSELMRTDADIAHGLLMGIAVVLFFPIGALITRLSKSRHMLWIHVGCQVAGLLVFFGGFGTGVWTCIIHDEVNSHQDLLTYIINV